MIDPTLFVAGVLAVIATINLRHNGDWGSRAVRLIAIVWLLYVYWRGL